MNIDCEVSALLSVAMNEPSKARKAAALALIESLRSKEPIAPATTLANAADVKHGAGVGAEVLILARRFGLG